MTDLQKRVLREFLTRLIKQESQRLRKEISKAYDKFIYSEKTRYSQSKEYWDLVKKGEPKHQDYGLQSELDKLDVWVAKRGERSKGDPHITYSSNQYGDYQREENPLLWSTSSGTSPIGYKESMSKTQFFKKRMDQLIEQSKNNPLISLICKYTIDSTTALESVEFEDFYSFCVINEIKSFDKYFSDLEDSKALFSQGRSVNSITIAGEYEITPMEIKKAMFSFSYNTEEISEVLEDSIVDVTILETNRTSTLIIITNIFPHLKSIIGLKIGESFYNPNTKLTYRIDRVVVSKN